MFFDFDELEAASPSITEDLIDHHQAEEPSPKALWSLHQEAAPTLKHHVSMEHRYSESLCRPNRQEILNSLQVRQNFGGGSKEETFSTLAATFGFNSAVTNLFLTDPWKL